MYIDVAFNFLYDIVGTTTTVDFQTWKRTEADTCGYFLRRVVDASDVFRMRTQ